MAGVRLLPGDQIDTRTGMARLDIIADRGPRAAEGKGPRAASPAGGPGRPLIDAAVYANRKTLLGLLATGTETGEATVVVELARGEVYVENSGRKVPVRTLDGLISPLGTRFEVKRTVRSTLVRVVEGAVQAKTRGVAEPVRIENGYQAVLRKGVRPAAPVKISVGRIAKWVDRLLGSRRVSVMTENMVVLEAERHTAVVGTGGSWTVEKDIAGFVGEGYVRAEPPKNWIRPDEAPKLAFLEYRIHLPEAGEYNVVIRGWAPDKDSETAYISLDDGALVKVSIGKFKQWVWSKPVKVRTDAAGIKILRLLQRETGFRCDRLVIARRPDLRFRGEEGPPETPTVRVPARRLEGR